MAAWIDETELQRAAMAATGLSDFGHPHYLDGLRAFIESADRDAHLNAIGRQYAIGIAELFLRNRLLLAHTRTTAPHVFEQPLLPPIIVFGLPRTGTTLLHRLLALDPAHRAIPLWELLRPIPYEVPDRRRALALESDSEGEGLKGGYDHVHYSRADSPEECVILLATTFCSALFSAFLPVYGYAEWGLTSDKTQVYREYQYLLQILQTVDPMSRLTLKSPAHLAALPELVAAIPDAILIQTHRDPVTACVSAISNSRALQAPFIERFDTDRMTGEVLHSLATSASRALAFRRDHPGRIHDVMYPELVTEPVETVRRIYDRFALAWSPEHEGRIEAYLHSNPQNKHGRHEYSAEEFGLTDAQIADRFAAYCDTFDLWPAHIQEQS
jgi:hypothetical protein